jgi:hypothetical protein
MRGMHTLNQFAAPCDLCGNTVPAGEGMLFAKKGKAICHSRDRNPEWVVQHRKTKYCGSSTNNAAKEGEQA